MDEEDVREYVDFAQSTIKQSPQMDEANTKAAILQPSFLNLLGWEIPTNTQLEYAVEAFGKTYWVDYALILDGTPVAFIEAKGVDTPLKDKHRSKVRDYLKTEDVNLGILTNVKEYEFFRRQGSDSKVKVNRLAKTTLQNLPEKVNVLEAFTKSAIQSDEWVRILNRIQELEQARETLTRDKDDIAEEITQVLTDTVSGTIAGPAESQAKEMIDRLIVDIEEEIDSDRETPPEEEQPDDEEGQYVVRLLNGDTLLTTISADSQSDAMTQTVNYLVEEHDLPSKIESLPYIPGKKRAILAEQLEYGDREIIQAREISNSYYLETNLNAKQKKREMRRFAEKCGLEVEYDGSW